MRIMANSFLERRLRGDSVATGSRRPQIFQGRRKKFQAAAFPQTASSGGDLQLGRDLVEIAVGVILIALEFLQRPPTSSGVDLPTAAPPLVRIGFIPCR